MHIHTLEQRKCDKQGCGHWGASRGSRKHRGVDLVCDVGDYINSPVNGVVTKIGFPYGDSNKHHIRYIEIENSEYKFRVFYVDPAVAKGETVTTKTVIGVSQELGCFYNGITEHIHLEIKDKHGNYVDPNPFLIARNI